MAALILTASLLLYASLAMLICLRVLNLVGGDAAGGRGCCCITCLAALPESRGEVGGTGEGREEGEEARREEEDEA